MGCKSCRSHVSDSLPGFSFDEACVLAEKDSNFKAGMETADAIIANEDNAPPAMEDMEVVGDDEAIAVFQAKYDALTAWEVVKRYQKVSASFKTQGCEAPRREGQGAELVLDPSQALPQDQSASQSLRQDEVASDARKEVIRIARLAYDESSARATVEEKRLSQEGQVSHRRNAPPSRE